MFWDMQVGGRGFSRAFAYPWYCLFDARDARMRRIVISASHNPYYDNGIKIFSENGFKLPDEIEDELEQGIFTSHASDSFPLDMGIGRAKRIDDAVGQYAVFLKEQFPKHLNLEGLRIVLDCANGAAYKVAPKVFEELGAELFVVGDKPDGKNINDECGALYPGKLKDLVRLFIKRTWE